MPVTVGPVRASEVPFWDSCAATFSKNISESSIALFNSMAHVNLTSDPTIWVELASLLVSVINDGVGTIHAYKQNHATV